LPKGRNPSRGALRHRTRSSRAEGEKTASFIVIGDEILSGRTEDTNSIYLARSLRELGVRLMLAITIPDDPALIKDALELCRHRFDYVFTSGGLGPTHDDVTLEGISQALGVPVVRHPDLEKRLRSLYGETLNEDQLRMAAVPEGAALHSFSNTRLPVISIENIYLFPGIPELFQQKFDAIKERFRSAPYFSKELLCTEKESDIAQLLRTTLRLYPGIKIGSYPRWGDDRYKVKIVVESKDKASVKEACSYLQTELRGKGR